MIPSDETHLPSSLFNHPGNGGKNNEDRYTLNSYQLSESDATPSLLAIVADGRGGQRAGEVAAQTVVDVVGLAVAQSDASQPNAILQSAIIQAGQSIAAQSESEAEKRGMGSTCLCVWIIANRLYTASLGNSRLFHSRQGRLQQMNIVHNLVPDEDNDEAGDVVQMEGKKQPEELQGFLGARMRTSVDFRLVLRPGGEANAERNQGTRLQANDRLLLCSDGLSDALGKEEIAQILSGAEIDKAAEALVQAALKNDAQDNLSAIVLGMPPARPTPSARRMRLRPILIIAFASLLLVLLSLTGWFFLGQRIDPGHTPQPSPVNTLTPLPSHTPELP